MFAKKKTFTKSYYVYLSARWAEMAGDLQIGQSVPWSSVLSRHPLQKVCPQGVVTGRNIRRKQRAHSKSEASTCRKKNRIKIMSKIPMKCLLLRFLKEHADLPRQEP